MRNSLQINPAKPSCQYASPEERASLDFGFPWAHVLSMVHGSGSVTPEIDFAGKAPGCSSKGGQKPSEYGPSGVSHYAKMFERRWVPLSFSGLQWQEPMYRQLANFCFGGLSVFGVELQETEP